MNIDFVEEYSTDVMTGDRQTAGFDERGNLIKRNVYYGL